MTPFYHWWPTWWKCVRYVRSSPCFRFGLTLLLRHWVDECRRHVTRGDTRFWLEARNIGLWIVGGVWGEGDYPKHFPKVAPFLYLHVLEWCWVELMYPISRNMQGKMWYTTVSFLMDDRCFCILWGKTSSDLTFLNSQLRQNMLLCHSCESTRW